MKKASGILALFTNLGEALPGLKVAGAATLLVAVVLALLSATGAVDGLMLAPTLLLVFFPGILLVVDDDEVDDSAKTIVAMPVWMIQELAKEKEKLAKENAEQPLVEPPTTEDADAVGATAAFDAADIAAVREEVYGKADPVPEPPPEDTGAVDATAAFDAADIAAVREEVYGKSAPEPEPLSEDLDTEAATAIFNAADIAAARDAVYGKPEAAPPPEEPPVEEEPPAEEPEQSAPSSIKSTASFGMEDLEALRAQATSAPEPAPEEASVPATGPQPDGSEDFDAMAQTAAFDVAEVAALREKFQQEDSAQAQAAPPPEPAPTAEEPDDMANAATMMFDAKSIGLYQGDQGAKPAEEQAPPPVQSAVDPGAVDQTLAYSVDEINKMREKLQMGESAEDEEDEANAKTAFMPAMGGPELAGSAAPQQQQKEAAPAKTVAYMPQQGDDAIGQTMAYGPEDREKLVAALAQGKSPEEAVDSAGSTMAYSPQESAALREAYDLLEQDKVQQAAARGRAPAQAQAPQPQPRPAAPQPAVSPTPMAPAAKTGMGTGSLILVLLLLLVLAGGATAFILHFLGVVELPVNLPQLDLSSK
jgi:hypothetical protein